MNKVETIICANCNKPFDKRAAELKRWRKQGKTNFYCGLSCCAIYGNKTHPHRNQISLVKYAGNRRDIYTQFRLFIKNGKRRDKINNRGKSTITIKYLSYLWEQQKGTCPFTGWTLLLPDNVDGWTNGANIKNASLDRINNNFGYVQGNVRFVSVMANYARNAFNDDDLIYFCNSVVKNQSCLSI